MTKTEEDKMKQWKLAVVALLSLLLVCGCMSAMASSTCTHEDSLGNSLYQWVEKTAATCSATGTKEYKCSNCGDVTKTATIEKLAHTPSESWEVTVAATCLKEGTRVKKCTVCSAVLESKSIAKLAHEYNDSWTQTVAPTCTKVGTEVIKCSRGCGTVLQSRDVAKIDHTLVQDVAAVAPTCEKTGTTAIFHCSVCGTKVGGEVVKALGHDWYDDKDVNLSVAATCDKDGKDVWVCKRDASHTKTVVLKATGHNFNGAAWYTKAEATCAKAGVEARKCSKCDAEETRSIAKLKTCKEDTLKVTLEAIAPTCEKAGRTAEKQCTVCGKVTASKVVKATGHNTYDDVWQQPTCTVDGYKNVICKNANCDYADKIVKKDVKVVALGHKPVVDKENSYAATPEKDGLTVYKCSVCGFETSRKFVKYSEMLYNNTITAAGPCTRDLIGGKDWYRVTPIDLSVEGTFTYDLIASNKYTVGTATVTIANGTLTVTYNLNASHMKVNSEALIIYPNLDALRNPTPANTVNAAYGAPIDIAATFGEDTKVILSVYLKADYNEIGAGVYGFKVNQAQIDAMTAIID